MKKGNPRRNTHFNTSLKGEYVLPLNLTHKQTINYQGRNEEECLKEFTKKVWGEIKELKVSNFGLLFYKLIPPVMIESSIERKGNGKKLPLIEHRIVNRIFLEMAEKYSFSDTNYIRKNIDAQIKALSSRGYRQIFDKEILTSSPLVVGLGIDSTAETSLCLHRIYGIPYIPGSAFKGVVRNVLLRRIAENMKRKVSDVQNEFEEGLSKDKKIRKWQLLLGTKDFKGLLIFLDVFPVITQSNSQILRADIMNVHFPNYYKKEDTKKKSLNECENPNPIVFLTIKEGVPFRAVALLDEYRMKKLGDAPHLKDVDKVIENVINECFKEYGVGAKTRLGYGRFEGSEKEERK